VRGEADPHGVGVIVGNLHSVNMRIGAHCGRRSWDLRDPVQSFMTFPAGVVCNLCGVGVGEVIHDVVRVSLSVMSEVRVSLAVFPKQPWLLHLYMRLGCSPIRVIYPAGL